MLLVNVSHKISCMYINVPNWFYLNWSLNILSIYKFGICVYGLLYASKIVLIVRNIFSYFLNFLNCIISLISFICIGVTLVKERLIFTWKPKLPGEKLIVKQIMINKRILTNCVIEVKS